MINENDLNQLFLTGGNDFTHITRFPTSRVGSVDFSSMLPSKTLPCPESILNGYYTNHLCTCYINIQLFYPFLCIW